MLYIPEYEEELELFLKEAKDTFASKTMVGALYLGPHAIVGYMVTALPWLMGASPIPGLALAVVYTIVSYLVYTRYLRVYSN